MSDRFRMLIGDIFRLPKGPAVTGYIFSGRVCIGDSLTLVGLRGDFPVRVVAIERFRASLQEAEASDKPVALTLGGVEPDDIHNRDFLVGNLPRPA